MPNYRVDLEYDGTDFHGWQVQPGLRTVQGELVRVLSEIVRAPVAVVGAGRTDAGVHALGQVASFQLPSPHATEKLTRMLNAALADDIRILSVAQVDNSFSARHSAIARRYRYQMSRRRSPLRRRFFYELRHGVDVAVMSQAAAWFLGDQDFTAFVASDAGSACRCLVSRSSVYAEHDAIFFEITANRFLHNMVRRLSGALVEVGRGRLPPDAVRDILRRGDRSRGGPCLPPHGLYLLGVGYPSGQSGPPFTGPDHRDGEFRADAAVRG